MSVPSKGDTVFNRPFGTAYRLHTGKIDCSLTYKNDHKFYSCMCALHQPYQKCARASSAVDQSLSNVTARARPRAEMMGSTLVLRLAGTDIPHGRRCGPGHGRGTRGAGAACRE